MSGRSGGVVLFGSPLAELVQKLLRRYEERILLEDAPDDDHRMRPHDVNNRVSSKSSKVVYADDRIVVATPQIVHTRFEFKETVDVRSILGRPIHVADNSTEWKSAPRIAAGQLLEYIQHPILIKAAVSKVCFGVSQELQLPALLGGRRIDACRSQALQMVAMLARVDDVNRFVATLEAVLDERKQHAIFFVVTVEERAHMTYFV
jgi:hypothetical protein